MTKAQFVDGQTCEDQSVKDKSVNPNCEILTRGKQYIKETGGTIFTVPFFDRRGAADIIMRAKESRRWQDAPVVRNPKSKQEPTAGKAETSTKLRSALVLSPDDEPELFREFSEKVETVAKPLASALARAELTRHEGMQMIWYGPGGRFVPHTDNGGVFNTRYITVLCYLNDDFEGGSTTFPDLGHEVTPESGKVVFPSDYLHCGEAVTRGDKYVLVTWLVGSAIPPWL
jgi:predicted 2-oxoglutarate/Fe(II)-dependent dioxygenase YbiX